MVYTAEQQRERYYANLEENRRKHREYAQANRDKLNAQRRANRAANPERERERDRNRVRDRTPATRLRDRHGRAIHEDVTALLQAQDGRCYLCGDELADGKFDIDHDHGCCPAGSSCRTCRRGLTYHRCNVIIGWAQDDPARLRRMADGLETAQKVFRERRVEAEQLF